MGNKVDTFFTEVGEVVTTGTTKEREEQVRQIELADRASDQEWIKTLMNYGLIATGVTILGIVVWKVL